MLRRQIDQADIENCISFPLSDLIQEIGPKPKSQNA